MTQIRRIFFLILFPQLAGARIPDIQNLDEIANNLNLKSFKERKYEQKVKVAILDDGFKDYKLETTLPTNTSYDPGPSSIADNTDRIHGTLEARLLSDLIIKSGAKPDYDLHLIKTFGLTKFAAAVDRVIAEHFDLVIYANVSEFGGIGDGRGFINALVTKALNSGVIWINAAGDFGRLTRLAPVDGKMENGEEWVVFKNTKGQSQDGVVIKCLEALCKMRVVLAWSAFAEDKKTGTEKDLDLFVFDKNGKPIGKSERRQKVALDSTSKEFTLYPYEFVRAEIPKGEIKVRVKVFSKNFSASQDLLRITVSGSGLELEEPSLDETLLPPTDNPNGIITIGASDDLNSSSSKTLNRPDVLLRSTVRMSETLDLFRSSLAAPMAGAVALLHLASGGEKTRDAVLAVLKPLAKSKEVAANGARTKPKVATAVKVPHPPRQPSSQPPAPQIAGGPVPVRQQVAQPRSPHLPPCFHVARLPMLYPAVQALIARGAQPILLRGRPALLTQFNFADLPPPTHEEHNFITPRGPVRLPATYENAPLEFEVITGDFPICEMLAEGRPPQF